MQAVLLKCRPSSQFHFGEVAIDADTSLNDTSSFIHSDTIFSGLVNVAAKTLADTDFDAFLTELGWQNNESVLPQTRLSSAFYVLEKEISDNVTKRIFFLPKPIHLNLKKITKVGVEQKDLKALEFISKGIWESDLTVEDWFDGSKCVLLQDGSFVCLKSELAELGMRFSDDKESRKFKIFRTYTTPKVNVHHKREDREGTFYTQTNLQIRDSHAGETVHFYFLIDGTLSPTLKQTIRMLAHEGIGGERTTGCGFFENAEFIAFSLAQNAEDGQVLMSLGIPKTENEFALVGNYQLLKRGGRGTINDGTLKKVNMIAEGAFLTSPIDGTIINLSVTSNPFLRSGICFTLPYHNK